MLWPRLQRDYTSCGTQQMTVCIAGDVYCVLSTVNDMLIGYVGLGL